MERFDIVLVNTPALPYFSIPQNDQHGIPALGLVSIAAFCRREGFNVAILDADNKRMPVEKIISTLNKMDTRFVGLNCMSENIELVKKIAAGLKHPVIVGGVHPTLMPEKTFSDFPQLYALVHGEAEIPVADILAGKHRQDIPGIVFEEGGRVFSNPRGKPLNLAQLPIPDMDLFEPSDRYHLITSRHCSRGCSFCISSVLGKVRFVPMDRVIAEMCVAYFWGKRYFHFLDDEFLSSKKRAKQFLQGLKSANLFGKIRWRAISRPDEILLLGDDIIQELKDSGGEMIAIGVISGSQRIIEMTHREISIEAVKEAVKILKKHGFKVKAYVILGFPDETYEEMMETKALLMELGKLGLYYFSMTILRIYPGTEIYSDLIKCGYSPEDIIFEDPCKTEGIDERYVYGSNNRNKVQIAKVSNQQILEIAKEIIDEFNEKFCPKKSSS